MRNNKLTVTIISLLLLTFSVTGCANRAQTGAAVGGAGGALIGSTTGSWLIGGGLGAALGYIIGNEWDKYDEQQAQSSFRSGQATSWKSNEGRKYAANPSETYYQNGREYKKMTITDSTGRKSDVILVKRNDGKWEVAK